MTDIELMRPMVGTPAPGSLPRLETLVAAVADNTPMCEVFPQHSPGGGGVGGGNRQGFRDMLVAFEAHTHQTPALLDLYRRAYTKQVRELDMHAAEHKKGIDLAIKKAKGL